MSYCKSKHAQIKKCTLNALTFHAFCIPQDEIRFNFTLTFSISYSCLLNPCCQID